MLQIDGLDVSIGSVSVLRNVNLAVPNGKFAGLIGRNGAGKTTLMRSIMGALPCRRGAVTFDGQSLNQIPPHGRARLGIGYMPEDRRLIPSLTVEENVLLPAWATAAKTTAERLAKIYRIIPEAEAFAPRKGLQLSGGQQKLAALARALMCGTRLLLLDEPFEGVAPVLCQRLAEVISQLKQEGVSVILSESDLSHSRDMLDVVYTIDRGEVTQAA
ncbi:MAG: ATP-binding cassette domain-containing protein [Bradyrhizobium sp.]|nr:ATP-binding cassette domain-containing protein [Bradyrhizobium sp.]